VKLPRELIQKLVEVESELEAWSIAVALSEGDENDREVLGAIVTLQNAVTDIVLNDEYGDEKFVATIAKWNCLQHLRPAI